MQVVQFDLGTAVQLVSGLVAIVIAAGGLFTIIVQIKIAQFERRLFDKIDERFVLRDTCNERFAHVTEMIQACKGSIHT